ncbi:TolC family protein [Gelidibacter maritimus]|uniref:TolC family protein n=1 Tax=Gelidibacter maritimus TaxID=2761487 RepID=A0A7W2M697_9FLAO|nr:TolC family protein [Gelidibacter maritimus]MBA6153488.1 TolC family protein [Gelidibacter maritimus]
MTFIFKIFLYLAIVVGGLQSLHAQTPYTLEKVLKTTRLNNPILKSEHYNVAIAESDILSAELRPNLVLSNETIQIANSSDFENSTNWGHPKNREVLWQLSKTFQIMGQRQNKIEVAQKSAQLSQKEYTEIESAVLFEVAQKWNDVWTAQKQLELIKSAKDNIDSLVITNQHRFRNQVITQTDVFRTELLAKQYALQYATERQELANRKKELQFIMGIQDTIQIDTSEDLGRYGLTSLNELLQQSMEFRSDIQVAKSMIEVSESNIHLQKSMAYPQPEIGVIYNAQNKVPHFGFAASIDLPFFDRNQGEVKKSLIQRDQAEQQFHTLQTQLQTEITTAYESHRVQLQNIKNYQSVLEQSQTILDNIKYAYLRGGTSIVDFLEAQSSWLETQEQYNDVLEQYRQSHIQLLYVAGLINQLAQ